MVVFAVILAAVEVEAAVTEVVKGVMAVQVMPLLLLAKVP
jgi:hypothetical protein